MLRNCRHIARFQQQSVLALNGLLHLSTPPIKLTWRIHISILGIFRNFWSCGHMRSAVSETKIFPMNWSKCQVLSTEITKHKNTQTTNAVTVFFPFQNHRKSTVTWLSSTTVLQNRKKKKPSSICLIIHSIHELSIQRWLLGKCVRTMSIDELRSMRQQTNSVFWYVSKSD